MTTSEPSESGRSFETRADLVLLVLAVATLSLAAALRIRDSQAVLIPWTEIPLPETCWTRRVLKVDCPGCGMTRSFIRLAHGDWRAACEFNLAGPVMFALVAAQIPWRTWQIWRERSGRGRWHAPWWAYSPLAAVVVVMFGQWFWRMLT